MASLGRTHQSPGDMALMDTLDAHLHANATAEEVDAVLRHAVAHDGLHHVRVVGQTNSVSHPVGPRLHPVRRGSGAGPVVVALGPVLDTALAATEGLDVTVLYSSRVGREEHRRYGTPADQVAAPGLDAAGIRAALERPAG